MLIGSLLARLASRSRQSRRGHPLDAGAQPVPVVGAEEDDLAAAPAHSARTSSTIARVVGGLERRRRDQHAHAGLVEHVGEFVGAVGRVDVDQDRADLGGGVLHDASTPRSSAPRCRPGRPARCPAPSDRGRPRRPRRRARRRSSAGPLATSTSASRSGWAAAVRVEVRADGLLEERRVGRTRVVGLHRRSPPDPRSGTRYRSACPRRARLLAPAQLDAADLARDGLGQVEELDAADLQVRREVVAGVARRSPARSRRRRSSPRPARRRPWARPAGCRRAAGRPRPRRPRGAR